MNPWRYGRTECPSAWSLAAFARIWRGRLEQSGLVVAHPAALAKQRCQWCMLQEADGRLKVLPSRRFGAAMAWPLLTSPGFVKKLRHAGIQRYSKAAQRIDPYV